MEQIWAVGHERSVQGAFLQNVLADTSCTESIDMPSKPGFLLRCRCLTINDPAVSVVPVLAGPSFDKIVNASVPCFTWTTSILTSQLCQTGMPKWLSSLDEGVFVILFATY